VGVGDRVVVAVEADEGVVPEVTALTSEDGAGDEKRPSTTKPSAVSAGMAKPHTVGWPRASRLLGSQLVIAL